MQENWMSYYARDFSALQFASFSYGDGLTDTAIIMIHGITAEIDHHREFAKHLQAPADVYYPILRGYDRMNPRVDLSYVRQYDDDLFDFIHFVKRKGYKRIILAGHSMGCANMLRLLTVNRDCADGFVFIAPFFHPTLPVYQDDATEQDKPETDVDYTVFQKKAMLLMTLNKLRIARFNHKTVAEIPDEFHATGKLELSFRLLFSRFLEILPDDLFQELSDKIRIFVGTDDEVIKDQELAKWLHDTYQLKLDIIEDTDHNHILHDSELHQELKGFISPTTTR